MNVTAKKVASCERRDLDMREYTLLEGLTVSTACEHRGRVAGIHADAVIETLDQTYPKQSLKKRHFLRLRWADGTIRPEPRVVARVLVNEVQAELNRQGLTLERVLNVRFMWSSQMESFWEASEIGATGRVIPQRYTIDRSVHRPFWVENLIRLGALKIQPAELRSHHYYPESLLRYTATLQGHACTYALEEGDVIERRADGLLTAHFRSDLTAGTIGN